MAGTLRAQEMVQRRHLGLGLGRRQRQRRRHRLRQAISAPPDVLLEEFCRYYGVNATDQARLSRLEFEPGDEIDSLPGGRLEGLCGIYDACVEAHIAKNQALFLISQGGLFGLISCQRLLYLR